MVRVDVWSDIVCPWCYLGHAHLQAAATATGIPVELHFHAYQLAPELQESRPAHEHVVAKYGDRAMVDGMRARLLEAGAAVGIRFDFDAAIAANTFDAHRVHQAASEAGIGGAVMGQFLVAMHEQGADMSDHPTLVRLASEAGMDAAAVEAVLASDTATDAVLADLAAAHRMGISGVPFWVFNQQFALSGAQPVAVFEEALRKASDADS
ncbi:MAG: DsbA family oxidoreductase [Thermoplasmatota archaeon]